MDLIHKNIGKITNYNKIFRSSNLKQGLLSLI